MASTIEKNGWTGEVETNDPNLQVPLRWVCNNLKHDEFSFAKSIYINKVFVDLTDGTIVELKRADFSSFSLNTIKEDSTIKKEYQDLFQYDGDFTQGKFLFSEKGTTDYYHFNRHNFQGYGVSGSVYPYQSNKIDSNFPLYVFTSLSFGPYGTNPPHEFSGGLNATRFMPSIWFGTKSKKIKAVRFDYRFHLRTDDRASVPQFDWPYVKTQIVPTSNNFASIIRDSDELPVISCFNDLLNHFDELLTLVATYNKTLTSLLIELHKVINGYQWDRVDDLIEDFTNLIILGAKIPVKITQILGDLVLLKPCIEVDIVLTTMKALPVLVSQFEDLIKDFSKVFAEVVVLVALQLELIKSWAELGALYFAETLSYIMPSFWTDIFSQGRKLVEAKINQIYKARDQISKMLVSDFLELWKGMVYTFAKIFNLINFEKAEKPVLKEIAGNYILKGEVSNTWDNLHWWGTNFLPSAPGAFHAIHQHFRWSKFLGDPSAAETLAIKVLFKLLGGGAQLPSDDKATAPFRSLVEKFKDAKIGGPLIDPGLPEQTIRFAVAKVDSSLDKGLKTISGYTSFVDLAKKLITPEVIAKEAKKHKYEDNYEGSDIVYWLSIKAYRDKMQVNTFSGTLLINGFYFAHDPEPEASWKGSEPTNFAAVTQKTSIDNTNNTTRNKIFREPF